MEIVLKRDKWIWRKQPGIQFAFDTKEEAYAAAGIEMPAEIPLPEVREYDSMEDAIAEED
jgi:hypothetical protein